MVIFAFPHVVNPVTFTAGGFLSGLAAHLDGPVLYGLDDALPTLERYAEVMEERYAALERAKFADLHEFNESAAPEGRLARHVILIDEFQDLTIEKKVAERFNAVVGRLGAKARAAGVHLVLATQRPDRTTVPPGLKANLGGKVALRVASAVNSRVILDAAGAEALVGKGDLLADLARGLVRGQGAVGG
jgi:DNA segregation ATPase FtsK/SpoIIIE-like protein